MRFCLRPRHLSLSSNLNPRPYPGILPPSLCLSFRPTAHHRSFVSTNLDCSPGFFGFSYIRILFIRKYLLLPLHIVVSRLLSLLRVPWIFLVISEYVYIRRILYALLFVLYIAVLIQPLFRSWTTRGYAKNGCWNNDWNVRW